MVDFENKNKYGVYDLKKLIAVLRAPGGCPWDAEQTHESIKRNFLEETYEVIEAIDEKNPDHLCEELGDVLTQVVFHAGMEEEEGRFDLDDVADMAVSYTHLDVYKRQHLSAAVKRHLRKRLPYCLYKAQILYNNGVCIVSAGDFCLLNGGGHLPV